MMDAFKKNANQLLVIILQMKYVNHGCLHAQLMFMNLMVKNYYLDVQKKNKIVLKPKNNNVIQLQKDINVNGQQQMDAYIHNVQIH